MKIKYTAEVIFYDPKDDLLNDKHYFSIVIPQSSKGYVKERLTENIYQNSLDKNIPRNYTAWRIEDIFEERCNELD